MSLNNRVLVAFLMLGMLSMLPNLGVYEYKNEESLRTIVAWEMHQSGDYLQPRFMGELYWNKPPLFNWLALASAKLVGWSEMTVRTLSVASSWLTCLLIVLMSRFFFDDFRNGLLAALIYLTFPNVLFFYGMIGEIEATFVLFVTAMTALMVYAVRNDQPWLLPAAGLVAGLSFMLKGFAAFAFFGLSYLALVLHRRQRSLLWHPAFIIAGLLALAIPLGWIVQTSDPVQYLSILLDESARRTTQSAKLTELANHLVKFPLETLIGLLPTAGFLGYALYRYARRPADEKAPQIGEAVSLFSLLAAVNFALYLFSAGAAGRYVLPILPMLAIASAFFLSALLPRAVMHALVFTLAGIIALRFVMGLVVIPVAMEKKPHSTRQYAQDIMQTIDLSQPTVCDCTDEKAICLYINTARNMALKTSALQPDWRYNISCEEIPHATRLGTYVREKEVFLYERVPTAGRIGNPD